MKLEEIENMCEELPTEIIPGLEFRPDFVVTIANLVPKLLAVVKAAKTLAENSRYDAIEQDRPHMPGYEDVTEALAELERE